MSDDTHEPERVFLAFPLITIVAADEETAARRLFALDAWLNEQEGVETVLDEECYERLGVSASDVPWEPVRVGEEASPRV